MRRFLLFVCCLWGSVQAAPLASLVTVDDGLSQTNTTSIADDYVRLTLINPSYQLANQIRTAVENWLGPEMVFVESAQAMRIQAPRNPTQRVAFLAALMALDVADE